MADTDLLSTDPLDIALGPDGDLLIDENGLSLISGLEGIAQLVRFRLGMFKGEWFLNLDIGVDWYSLLGEHYDEAKTRAVIAAEIADVPGVLAVTELSIAFDGRTRELTIDWAATTLFGDTPGDTLPITLRLP